MTNELLKSAPTDTPMPQAISNHIISNPKMLLFLSGTPRILAAKTLCLTGLAIHGHPAFVLEGSIGFSSVTTGAASAIRKLVLYRVVGDLAHEAHHFLYSFLRKRGRKKGALRGPVEDPPGPTSPPRYRYHLRSQWKGKPKSRCEKSINLNH